MRSTWCHQIPSLRQIESYLRQILRVLRARKDEIAKKQVPRRIWVEAQLAEADVVDDDLAATDHESLDSGAVDRVDRDPSGGPV